jgi:sterol 14-demethylase
MSDKMKTYCDKIVGEVSAYFAKWGQSGEIDLHEAMSEITVLTASRCLLGDEIRETLHDRFAALYKHLNDGMTHLTVFWPYAPIKAHQNRDAARKEIVELFANIIQKRRRDQQAKPEEEVPVDFLQLLIDSKYVTGALLTDDEISGLLLAALFAGQHTSSITTTWMGLRMIDAGPKMVPGSNGQDIPFMQALRDEQKQVLAASRDCAVTVEALDDMKLLHSTMKETLRLYSPLVLLMRKVTKQLTYKRESDGSTFVVPAGDILLACPPVSHRLPEVFKNPIAFDPHRFMAPRNEGAGKFEFSPFGGGRHNCLGEQFAFLQIKTIWSTLVRTFDFQLVDPVPPIDYSAIVAGPKGSCKVRYTRLPQPVC